MIDSITLAIGVGLAVSLLLTELFGIAAGGMVVPGYLALSLTRPIDVALTLGVALATFGVVSAIGSFAIVYGRRRTAITLLVGFLLGVGVRSLLAGTLPDASDEQAYRVVGYVVPGLIALWIDRQGIVETLSALATGAVVVRLLLVLFGVELAS